MADTTQEPARHAHAVRVGRDAAAAGWQPAGGAATPAAAPLHRAPPAMLARIPEALARAHRVLPWAVEDGTLVLAAAAPLAPPDLAALALRAQMPVRVRVVDDPEALDAAIAANYRHVVAVPAADPGAPDRAAQAVVDAVLAQAVQARASDIHWDPDADGLAVRFRIDGVLVPVARVPAAQAPAVTAFLKVLAGLDYSQRGRPLDGHITRTVGGTPVDFRFASIGTAQGADALVLRVLARDRAARTLDALGFPPDDTARIRRLVQARHGLVLAVGPTGAGKTTTLHAAVRELDATAQHIVTLEDPVEALLPGVTQIPVSSAGDGVSFAEGLRAVLRHDPDVIVVGEMRDPETVQIAVQAALSGHLVFSSLHAIDAVGAVYRLLDQGVAPYLLAAALTGVVAQRLVRRVCSGCAQTRAPEPDEAAVFRAWDVPVPAAVRRGAGCGLCAGTGYAGRIAVAEVLALTEALRALVAGRAAPDAFRAAAGAAGWAPMARAALAQAAAGATTVAEVRRVLAVAEADA